MSKLKIDTRAAIEVMKALEPERRPGLQFSAITEADSKQFLKGGVIGSINGITILGVNPLGIR